MAALEAVELVESPKYQAILKAATGLFCEQGFHGTTVPEVAARAAVGAGTIYRYFPSKEALVNVVFQYWKTALNDFLLDKFPLMAPFREQFRTFWLRMVDFARRHPEG